MRKTNPPHEMTKRARYLFDELERDKAQIVLPSIVVTEFLCAVHDAARASVLAGLNRRFRIEPFDVRDTVLAAQLWDHGNARRKKGSPGGRVALRSDIYIIATAAGHGAKEFYTDDERCYRLAKQVPGITAKRLPTTAPNLFSWAQNEQPTQPDKDGQRGA